MVGDEARVVGDGSCGRVASIPLGCTCRCTGFAARRRRITLHVEAANGGGLLLSCNSNVVGSRSVSEPEVPVSDTLQCIPSRLSSGRATVADAKSRESNNNAST